MQRRFLFLFFSLVLIGTLLSGCASRPLKVEEEPAEIAAVSQSGVGKSRRFEDALELAFEDAMKKVVTSIIGAESENKHKDKIKTYMYDISETYVLKYAVTDKVKSGRDMIVYASVTFDKNKIEQSIRTLDIEIPQKEVVKDYTGSPYEPLISEAIDSLTYLVYFEPEKKRIQDEYARLCVNRVNNYLATRGYEYVDLERINEVKDEYFRLYEETQGAVSVVQLIAQALNADVYIVVDGIVEGEGRKGDIYFASASIDLKAFESATGRGLGAETGYSGKIGLASGMDAAKRKGVELAVEKAVKPVIELARNYMYKAFEEGIRYEVVVQGIPDYIMTKTFTEALKNTQNFRSLKEVAVASGQARYYVYYMGRKDELIDEILNNLQREEGFESMNVVLSRGNAVVFGMEE